MTEVLPTNYRDIQFTRDTKIDYKNGNAIINTIFKRFDMDKNGKFDDKEWNAYSKYILEQKQIRKLVTRVNNNTTKYYDKKLINLSKQYAVIDKKASSVDWTAFDKLLDFEEKHPNLVRAGSKNGNIPEGAYKFEIAALEMGIYDTEKDCFTGKCYKEGYILGLEKLSTEERDEYLKLLKEACEVADKGQKIDIEYAKLDNEIRSYSILFDYARNGYIDGAVSKEKAQKLIKIYNNANPFYAEIKDIEVKRQQLWLKGNKTEEDIKLLDQYDIQLRQLHEASSTWSISEADKYVYAQLEKEGFISQITPLQLSYQDKKLTNTTSANFNYSNDNWDINGAFSNSIGTDRNFVVHHTYLASFDTKYNWDKLMLRSYSNINSQEGMCTINQKFDINYQELNVSIGEDIVTVNADDIPKETTYTTKANVGYNTENFSVNTSGSITPREVTEINELGEEVTKDFADYFVNTSITYRTGVFTNATNIDLTRDSQDYSLSSSIDYRTNLDKNFTFSTNSSFTGRYSATLNSFELSPNATIDLGYKNGDFTTGLVLTEQYSTILSNGSKPFANHNFTANGGVAFNGFSGNVKINDSDSPTEHSNTYGLTVSKDFGKYGHLELEGSYQKNKNKVESTVDENITVSANYKLTF